MTHSHTYVNVRGSEEAQTEILIGTPDKISIDPTIHKKWQRLLSALAATAQIPSALIMQVAEKQITVFAKSSNDQNVYTTGATEELGNGLYCEHVLGKGQPLLVPDATSDPLWADNPDIPLGMISYYGTPVHWPNGTLFGTICILDSKRNSYSDEIIELVSIFRDTVQSDLELIQSTKEREQLISILKKTRDDALDGQRIKTDFLSMMSHELRTPLTQILSSSELIKEENLNQNASEMAGIIYDASQHMLMLINDILDLAKLEKKAMRAHSEACDLPSFLNDIYRTFHANMQQKGLQWDLIVDPNTPRSITTDQVKLRQIIINLISNALKFTETGSINLLAALSEDRQHLQISVKDSGIGIPQEKLSHIFDAFTQIYSSSHRDQKGTGLGLDISRRLTQLLGGTLTVQSELDQGSVFTLSIPTHVLTDQPPQSSQIDHQIIHALLVEDDVTNAYFMNREVRSIHKRIRMTMVKNGVDALSSVQTTAYDLIIINIPSSDSGDLALVQSLRADLTACDSNAYVISHSTDSSPSLEKLCLDAGCNWHLTKPIAPRQLAKAIKAFINR